MTASNRGAKNRSLLRGIRSPGAQSEDIGNKRSFEEVRIPPDNMGNTADDDDEMQALVDDGIGNSLDENPAHLNSGILSQLAKKPSKISHKRRAPAASREIIARTSRNVVPVHQVQGESLQLVSGRLAELFRAEDYMKNLIAEFALLLKNKSGQPFSFSMKETSSKADEVDEEILSSFKDLIKNILVANGIAAGLEIVSYRGIKHRVAVFFVSPAETDPLKNKELISALRMAVSPSVKQILQAGLNVFLALANAQNVIEEHLSSLGTKRNSP